MAFSNRMLFWRFLALTTVETAFCLVEDSVESCEVPVSPPSRFLLLSSGVDCSTMGHANPVRGVYAGLWLRKISRELCNECRDVN